MSRRRARKQSKKKGRFYKVALICLVSVPVFFVALGLIAKLVITKEFLEAEIEDSITSEVEIGRVDVSLLRFPAQVTLSDVHLTPVAGRESDAEVKVERVRLNVSLFALLFREVNVKSIEVSGAEMTTTYRKDGSTSVEELFDSWKDEEDSESEDSGVRGGLNALEQEDFVARLGGLSVENSRVRILLEEMGVKLLCTDVRIDLDEIRVDPSRLHETNEARLKMSMKVRADSVNGWPYGELFLSGDAAGKLFDPETGEAEPEVVGDISISKDSWLNTRIPYITKAWSFLSVLEAIGIKVKGLPERASFGRSEAIAVHYHRGKVTVKKPLSIWVGDWELAALDGSWLDTGTDQHEVDGELLASVSSSEKFALAIQLATRILPENVRTAVVEKVQQQMYRDKRLLLEMKSDGDFSDPDIKLTGGVPDLVKEGTDATKELLKKKTKGLLDGLLNRE